MAYLARFFRGGGGVKKKFFLKTQALSRTTTNGFLGPYQNFEKTNIRFQKTCGRNDGRKGEQILFYWTLPASPGGLTLCKHDYKHLKKNMAFQFFLVALCNIQIFSQLCQPKWKVPFSHFFSFSSCERNFIGVIAHNLLSLWHKFLLDICW